ncbi:unnamed protein product [Brachionus calyciflorus]|uniref:EGF-like domain-containing protein n=1 Tax=Brachionus calyciflorus TaxID=104777 RepID=A0A813NDS9_9BILA|nr:unnamed protein product [Brachionus calyciflorus]
MIVLIIFILSNILKISFSQCLAIGSNDSYLRIWSQNKVFYKQVPGTQIKSLDYETENNLFLAGLNDNKVAISETINNNLTSFFGNSSINYILSLNKTHFVTGGNDSLVFYNILNQDFYPIVKETGFYGEILCLRFLKEDQLLLIGSKDYKILVYNLSTNQLKVSPITYSIKSFDFLNKDFIVFQCFQNSVCRVINDSLIALGLERDNKNLFYLWNWKKQSILYLESFSQILHIEILDPITIIYGQKNGRINLCNLSELKIINILNIDVVNALTTIKKCNITYLEKFSESESITSTLENEAPSTNHHLTTSTNGLVKNTIFSLTSEEISNKDILSSTMIQSELSLSTDENTLKNEVFNVSSTSSSILEIQAIFNGNNIKALTNFLIRNMEMNDCLKNCSGNGKCKFANNNKYECECNENYTGSSCEVNTLPCFSNPCRNNGSCINNLKKRTYTCECFKPVKEIILFYGQNCELKKDICENETCSNNGKCYDIENKGLCKCFSNYYGGKCEHESNEMKTIKSTIKITSILAFIILIFFFLTLLFLDISTFFCFKKPSKVSK